MSENINIIGVDFSNGEYNSAIAIRCGNCGEILYMTTTLDSYVIDCKIFKKCPKCNTEFKETLVYQ